MTRGDKRPGVLAGLVSDAAATEYDRLLDATRMAVGPGPDGFELDSPVGRELFEAGVLSVSGDGGFVRGVPPAVALRLALNRGHRRLQDCQTGLAQAWSRFARLAFSSTNLGSPNLDGTNVRIIDEGAEIAQLAAGLYRAPSRELRGTITGGEAARSIEEAVLSPPAESIAAGVRYRMIYDAGHASTSWGLASIERSVQAGEQSRLRQTVPVRMMHVDDAIALVTMGPHEALLIQSQPVVELLADWFDRLWTDPGTTSVGDPATAKLSPVRRTLLCLLVSGLTDEAIAHRTGKSVRTIRRHIKGILDVLGVDTRFAAGAAAAKRGWV